MRLFFSYARPDRARADLLVTRLRQAGIEVWLDSDLIGGSPWWDKILGEVRSCDAVLAAVSRASIGSQACRAERAYAFQLGKPVLPIALERVPVALYPADIASIQVVDYTEPDEGAAFRLAGAIYSLPKPKPLPFPLPEPPAVPRTRFGDLNDRIAEPALTMGRQLGIIGVLEEALAPTSDPDDRLIAIEMLHEMARRRDLYAGAARKIEALLAQAGDSAREPGPQPAATARPDGPGRPEASPPRAEPAQDEPAGVQWWRAERPEGPPPRSQPARSEPAESQPARSEPAGKPRVSSPPAPSGGPVKVHHAMAVTSAVLTFPLIVFAPVGIAALRCSSRAKASLAAQDLAGARQAASGVVLAFWVAIGIWVVVAAVIH